MPSLNVAQFRNSFVDFSARRRGGEMMFDVDIYRDPWSAAATPRAQVELVDHGAGRNITTIITTNSLNNFQFEILWPSHLLINKGE